MIRINILIKLVGVMTKKYNNKIPKDYNWIYTQYITLDKKIVQIAREFNCGLSVVNERLNRHNIPRITTKGKRNGAWKGDEAGIKSIHEYIKNRKPKPKLCERCKKNLSYELSNNNGIYNRDINNYEWLCRSCHFAKDGGMKRFY